MKRFLFALVLVLSCSFLNTASADSVHITQQLREHVRIDADFQVFDISGAPELTMKIIDFDREAVSRSEELANIFFQEPQSREIVHQDEAMLCLETPSDEILRLYLSGNVMYYDFSSYKYFEPAIAYVLCGLENPNLFNADCIFSASDFVEEHANFTLAEASKLVEDKTLALLDSSTPFSLSLDRCLSISYQQIAQAILSVANEDSLIAEKTRTDYPEAMSYDGWCEDDNLYVLTYSLILNGLPVFSDGQGIVLYEDIPYYQPLFVEAFLNKSGIFFMSFNIPKEFTSKESAPLLTPYESVDALGNYFDSIIGGLNYEVTAATLEYYVGIVPNVRNEMTFIPAWCFSMDLLREDTRYENYRVIRINAITGEFII